MRRTFVYTSQFDRDWARLGLGDDELQILEDRLLENPDAGDVIPGLAGARKIRIPLEGRGKRGGARAVYVDVVVSETIFLITAYAKNEQTDLSEKQKKGLRGMVEGLKEE